jgi:intracellular septation protein
MSTRTPTEKPAGTVTPAWLRAVVDYAGPACFVIAFFVFGKNILAGTWGLVAGSAVGLILNFAITRKVAPLPLIWGGAALVFGSLTLIFHDPVFVKMKTTFIDLTLGVALLIGLYLKKEPLKLLLGEALKLTEKGWRVLTVRYAGFFFLCAILNEIVWRTQPDATWVLFRMPGLLILAFAFSLTQLPMMMKDMKAAEDEKAEITARLTELQE